MKKRCMVLLTALLLLSLMLPGCGIDEQPIPSDSSQADQGIIEDKVPDTTQVTNAPSNDADGNRSEPKKEIDDDPASFETSALNPPHISDGSTFEIHYIDVGQGDSALVLCDGKSMLIDGGEASESSKIYSYLKSNGVSQLDYMVATHAHSDHIGGLSGALNYATVGIAYCPVTEYDSKTFSSLLKYLDAQGVGITVPTAGDTFALGSAVVQVLGPQKAYDDPNDTSIVLRVVYGDTSFLFTGDAERTAEADILEAGYDLNSTVLKVGHHGSDTSTSYPFLREIMPEYAVIQVGKDNSYGHPTEDTLSRLRDADVKVYRNDLQGTIICTSDGKAVSFSTERNESVQTNPTVVATPELDDIGEYIGNKNSKKFHLPTCKNLPAEKNRIYLSSRQEAIDGGFDPCGNCAP